MTFFTIEQFNALRFSIRLNKSGKNTGVCTAFSKCAASTEFKYSYNRKFKCFQINTDNYNKSTNFKIVDENDNPLDVYDLSTVMTAKFNTQKIWDFIRKHTDK